MRENVNAKAARYLAEVRVRIRTCNEDEGTLDADVCGLGAVYTTGRDDTGWFCHCQARGECCHTVALKMVTALEPRR